MGRRGLPASLGTVLVNIAPLTSELLAREAALMDWLRAQSNLLVAFSGGVDSAYLAWAAFQAVGQGAVALTARSASLSQRELEAAAKVASWIGIEHRVVQTEELSRPEYVENAASRCYFCKDTLFDIAALEAHSGGFNHILDGFNADDMQDFRPGHKAALEHGVKHPLAEFNLTKAEIRALSKRIELPTWNKPQLACMSSRIPYGMSVTAERLARVEQVEAILADLGFFDFRARLVRENDSMVRIEVGANEIAKIVDKRADIVAGARAAGFHFVTLDLEGFRSGRMNEELISIGARNSSV